jgi:hypothetical protein
MDEKFCFEDGNDNYSKFARTQCDRISQRGFHVILADKTIIFLIFVFVNNEERMESFEDDKFRSRYQKGDTRGAAIICRKKEKLCLWMVR